MQCHLVILKKAYLDLILAGRKTIESRFVKTRMPPFGCVRQGDKLFLKESAGPVCAVATAAEVKHLEDITPGSMSEFRQRYNGQICGDDSYWQSKMDCAFGTLVWLSDVRPISPVRINKKDWRAWVVLQPGRDYGLLRLAQCK